MTEDSDRMVSEVEKRLRESYGLWKAHEQLKKVYPSSVIALMGPSAPCDFLVVDKEQGNIVAIEVKASGASSKANRALTKAQREFGLLLESNQCWKAMLKKFVMYGEPGADAHVEEVPWKRGEADGPEE